MCVSVRSSHVEVGQEGPEGRGGEKDASKPVPYKCEWSDTTWWKQNKNKLTNKIINIHSWKWLSMKTEYSKIKTLSKKKD